MMKLRYVLLTCVAGILPVTAQAQSASEAGNAAETGGEIVVTAQKRSERLQDVPKTVDVVSGAALEKLNIRQFADVAQLTPGLTLSNRDSFTNSVTLRGIGFDPLSNAASTVDVYFNEVPISLFSAFRALYDVGQIEVLRGPQGTLRGRTSPAGAITIASRRPDLDKVEGFVQQTVTTQEGINSQGAVNVPIIEGVLAVRAAGLFDQNIGNGVNNITNGQETRDKTESARISVAFKPTSNLDFLLTYQHLRNSGTNYNALATIAGMTTDPMLHPSDRTALAVGDGYSRFTVDQVTLGADWNVGGVDVSYIGGYQNTPSYGNRDLALGGSIPDFTMPQINRSKASVWTHEVRISSKGNRTWNWLIGGFYSNTDSKGTVDTVQYLPFGFITPGQPPLDLSRIDVNVNIPSKVKDYAVFTDHRFQLTSRDLIEVGLRYQWQDYNRRFTLTLDGPVLGPNPIVQQGISPDNEKGTYKQLTGSASFKHDFSRDLTGYISYGRSYRPGGVITTTAPLDEDLLTFKPEKSNSYEVGLKGSLFDRKVNFTLSVFQQDFDGYQAYTGAYLATSSARNGRVDNNVAFTFNADARVRGVEATLSSQVAQGLQLGVSANYASAKFKNSLAPCNDFNGDGIPDSIGTPNVPVGEQVAMCNISGRLSDQAPWNLSVNGEYSFPVTDNADFFVRALLSYSPNRRDPFLDVRYNDYLNNSVFIGFRGPDSSYEFSVFAKNIANSATVLTTTAPILDYNYYTPGYTNVTLLKPREFGLVGRYSF